jgi:hypothetical protein
MAGRETRMPLRYYAQRTSKSALARRLGISRDTIHRWIRTGRARSGTRHGALGMVSARPIPRSQLCGSSTRFGWPSLHFADLRPAGDPDGRSAAGRARSWP